MDSLNEKKKLKKVRSFGITFSILFLIIAIYDLAKFEFLYLYFFGVSSAISLVTFFCPMILFKPSLYWEKLGLLLGKFFSPIILSLIYLLTIVPINFLVRLMRVDLLNKKINRKTKSYWIDSKDKHIGFKSQF